MVDCPLCGKRSFGGGICCPMPESVIYDVKCYPWCKDCGEFVEAWVVIDLKFKGVVCVANDLMPGHLVALDGDEIMWGTIEEED
jgi:hypothetical protein